MEKLLPIQPRDPPVKIMSREGVTEGDPLLMIPYKINLTPMDKKLRVADPGILSLFYTDDVAFDGSE